MDRLSELRRQRDLVQQHLSWLDAEIAAAEPSMDSQAQTQAPSAQPANPAPKASAPAPEELLRQFSADAAKSSQQARTGCWIAFAAAFLVLALIVGAWALLRSL